MSISTISESDIIASIKEFEVEFLEALFLQEVEEELMLQQEGPSFEEFLVIEEEEELNNLVRYVGNLNFMTLAERVRREEHAEWVREERKAMKASWLKDHKAKFNLAS